MRESSRATTWTCSNKCDSKVVRADMMQDVPPDGWRILHILPISLNLALEGEPHKVIVLCDTCFGNFDSLLGECP